MMRFSYKSRYASNNDCYLLVTEYVSDDTLAILVCNDDGPVSDLTKWIEARKAPELKKFGKNAAFLDTNNFPEAMAIVRNLHLGDFTGHIGCSGYCEYPFVVFDMENVKKYTEEGGKNE